MLKMSGFLKLIVNIAMECYLQQAEKNSGINSSVDNMIH